MTDPYIEQVEQLKTDRSSTIKVVYPRKKPSISENHTTWITPLLSPAAFAYRLGSAVVRKMKHAPGFIPATRAVVVSVGNIEAGGGGKTPFCIHLLEKLAYDGYRPVYISRGYKSDSEKIDSVTVLLPENTGTCPPLLSELRFLRRDAVHLNESVGDEGAMVASRLPQVPLLFSRHKNTAVRVSESLFEPTHIILDDAFQSWGVHRDLDIVLLDARRPFGNGRLIPAGSLREGSVALRRAGWIGFNDLDNTTDMHSLEKSIRKTAPSFVPVFGIRRELSFWSPEGNSRLPEHHSPIASLSSIARPASFDRSLQRYGYNVRLSIRFPDHHSYTRSDMERVKVLTRKNGIDKIITTEKDWVKLRDRDLKTLTLLIARLDLKIVPGDLLDKIKKPQASPAASV